MVVFLGKGSALWRGVVGLCPGCPEGGEGVDGGQWHPASLTCLRGAGYKVLPWSGLMIRGRWTLDFLLFLLFLLGPGPSSLLLSTRSNTIIIRMRHNDDYIIITMCPPQGPPQQGPRLVRGRCDHTAWRTTSGWRLCRHHWAA